MVIGRIVNHIGVLTAALALAAGSQAVAGEYAVLTDGFRLHADRHEVDGATVRLYANGGMMEMSAAQIAGYEQEEYTPPPPVKPAEPVAPPTLAAPVNHRELVAVTARKHGLPPAFVQSLVAAESAFRPDAISPKGAIGLMQLMPGTARTLGVDPHDPRQNVAAGARYLRELLTKYADHDDQVLRALAAYNAGPGAVAKYHGVPPYRETSAYIRRVLKTYANLQQ